MVVMSYRKGVGQVAGRSRCSNVQNFRLAKETTRGKAGRPAAKVDVCRASSWGPSWMLSDLVSLCFAHLVLVFCLRA